MRYIFVTIIIITYVIIIYFLSVKITGLTTFVFNRNIPFSSILHKNLIHHVEKINSFKILGELKINVIVLH